MTDHTATLLPCPFCNAAASVGKIGHDWWRLTIDHADDCALNSDYRLHALQTDKGLGRLAESWNTRAHPQQPAGWKLVPVEPTPEMLEAGRDAGDFHIMHYDGADKPGTPRYSLGRSYAAMLDAAPAHPSQQEDDVRDAVAPVAFNVEAAAKAIAECMDYPWAHMPEEGRNHMRRHAQAVIDAAMTAAQDAAQGGGK